MVVTQGRASVRTIGLTGVIEVQKTGCKGFGYTLYPKGYKLQGRRAGHPPAPGWLSHTQRAPPPDAPRPAAPRQAAPGHLPRRRGSGWHGSCRSPGQRQVAENAEKRTNHLVSPKVVKNPTMVATGAPESALWEAPAAIPLLDAVLARREHPGGPSVWRLPRLLRLAPGGSRAVLTWMYGIRRPPSGYY
jgi:hypothetical protein